MRFKAMRNVYVVGVHNGSGGDGKIFAVVLAECVRIRNAERGSKVIG